MHPHSFVGSLQLSNDGTVHYPLCNFEIEMNERASVLEHFLKYMFLKKKTKKNNNNNSVYAMNEFQVVTFQF
jgi:hypothetical protein